MSLFCFGFVSPSTNLKDVLSVNDDFTVQSPDEEDIKEMVDILGTKENLTFFMISDLEGRDATRLWNDALTESINGRDSSVLHRTLNKLIYDGRFRAGGIALVDGGIESITRTSRDDCWNSITDYLSKPWDTIDNPFIIWGSPET